MRAVSYTHLDVYKRQLLVGGVLSGGGFYGSRKMDRMQRLEQARAEQAAVPQPETQAASEADYYKAVSYTHLDVYKRQNSRRSISSMRTGCWLWSALN